MNEAETRAELIDPALKAAGWGVVEGSRVRREFMIAPGRIEGGGRRGKPITADYVLEYRNTTLAVIEAKARDKPLTEGAALAIRRGSGAAHLAHARHGHGQDIHRLSNRVETLSQPLEPEPPANPPSAHPFPRRPEHPRRPGLHCVLRLSRGCAGADRAGRSAQERQGADQWQHLLHDLPDVHVGTAKKWAAIALLRRVPDRLLQYFAPAVHLGLTATPKRQDNVDTYAYFGEPVFVYSLKEGINDGFLTRTARRCPRNNSWKRSSESCPNFSKMKMSSEHYGVRRKRARSGVEG